MIRFGALLRGAACVAASGVLTMACTATPPHGDPALVKSHVAVAMLAAQGDLWTTLTLCDAAEPKPQPTPEQMHAGLVKAMADSPMEPMRVFDNLYFVGSKWVSAWAVKTSEGLILIDAMDNDDEAEHVIVAGLVKLGLDPATIRELILTHAHGDHYGGAGYLIAHYHPHVIMSDADWRELEQPVLQYDFPEWGRPPKRDVTAKDGDTVTLGDTTVELILTPGHTTGTLSVVIPLMDGAVPHRALLWGGTGFNFGPRADRYNMYIASTDHALEVVRREKIDVMLSNHVHWDDSVAKMAALQKRQPGDKHPYVLGEPTMERFLNVAGQCAAATLASFDAGALPPKLRGGK